MSLTTRYWLNQINKEVSEEKVVVDKFRDELVAKYGDANEDGSISLPAFIQEEVDGKTLQKLNPSFIEFQKEFETLLNQEKEFSYKPLSLAEVENIQTSENCPIFLKLLIA